MNYKMIDLGTCRLHIMETQKFKTVDVRFFFYKEISKKDNTMVNCLLDMLTYATKKYPTKKELMMRCQELYSLFLSASSIRFGNYLLTRIGISFLNPKFTEESMIEDSFDLLKEVIFNPLVKDREFNEEILNIIKKDLRAESETIKEQSRLYSNIRMLENMDSTKPYAIHGYSDIEVLDEIDGKNLYEYYQQFITRNKIDIFVVGDVNTDMIIGLFHNKFKFHNNHLDYKPIVLEHDKIRKRAMKVIEQENYKQSKLSIGCKLKNLTDFEYKYVVNMYNMILGGNSDSLLMRYVREKHSLAYYVNSFLGKADNLLIINSGIDSNNFPKVMRLIKKAMQDVKDGRFKDEDLDKSKTDYIASLDAAMETSTGMVDIVLGKVLFNSDDLEVRKQKIMEVTKKDIMDLANKIYLDTIYLLKGE